MVTLPSAVVTLFLRLSRANRIYVSAGGARRHVRQAALRPATYGPPGRLAAGVRIDVRSVDGWPVYTVASAEADRRGGVVYLHGGGWVNEIAPQHWSLAAQIAAEANTTVTLPIYPLVPFGTARASVDGTVGLVQESSSRYGPTCLAGDSAGGQIALSSALALRDQGTTVPATILISPALDLTFGNPRIPVVQPTDPWLGRPGGRVFADLWRGDRDWHDPVVSPLSGDLVGLGPITLFSGTRDILNPDAHLLLDKAARAGVTIDFHEGDGQLHVFPLLPTRTGRQARATIVATLRRGLRD